jgi:putative protein kinase ArgK-like GTPase of G3E family
LLVINKADMPGASKLKFDLGREAAESDRVLETVAAENKGIAELLDRLMALEAEFRESGKLTQRRQRSRDKETVDRCLDLLRERLADLLHKQPPADIDPGVAAESLLERVLRIPG